MMRWMFPVLFALVSAPSVAQKTDLNSGNTFLLDCQSALEDKPSNIFGAAYCYGYLAGLSDGEWLKKLPSPELRKTGYGPEWKQWCEPTGVTSRQRAMVVV